jgi:steroid 5-alpha reductase family enzyme
MKNLAIVIVLGSVLAVAASQGSAVYAGVPVFALCAVLAFSVQWLAFIPAYRSQTEKYYDLTGSFTYLSVVAVALVLSGAMDLRSQLLALCVAVWAIRLGSFLFRRIMQDGEDTRFAKIKPDAMRFFFTWTLQGLWVLMTASCALAGITSTTRVELSLFDSIGLSLFVGGFLIEAVADYQKRIFRAQEGSGGFITTGLWAYSRHPNYFGEIMLWCGIALLALPTFSGWQWVTLVSPLFVYVLLTRISGVPLLERKSDKRWGEDPEYQAYKARTPVLMPRLR